ncbi:MAG: Nif3-like dinuclear metal center hexameric protein [Francisellaceae bacterium]
MKRHTLQSYLCKYLRSNEIKDYCPNGLQVEGKAEIQTIVTGVTACQALIDAAIQKKADAIIVHHGYFWKGEPYPITGMRYRRIASLIKQDLNLFAYHLPLDIHPEIGNNVMLAKKLKLNIIGEFDTATTPSYGIMCEPYRALNLEALSTNIHEALKRQALVIPANIETPIRKIAICTGGAQDFIEAAFHAGADVYISGEASERTTHMARELPIHYIAAGHHATERYGIEALGEHLARQFDLQHYFVDIDNPV